MRVLDHELRKVKRGATFLEIENAPEIDPLAAVLGPGLASEGDLRSLGHQKALEFSQVLTDHASPPMTAA